MEDLEIFSTGGVFGTTDPSCKLTVINTNNTMKKTQKILDCLKYIDNQNLSKEELIRLESEINSLIN